MDICPVLSDPTHIVNCNRVEGHIENEDSKEAKREHCNKGGYTTVVIYRGQRLKKWSVKYQDLLNNRAILNDSH